MKKLLLVLFVLVSFTGFSQELTADTPALDLTRTQQVWAFLTAAALTLFGYLARLFSRNASVIVPKVVETLTVFLKTWNHWRGSSVVIDTGMQVVSESGYDLAKKLEDGVLTNTERVALISDIKKRSLGKLKNLYGFVKTDLEAWAQEQASIFVGKLLYRGSAASGLRTNS